MKYSSAMWNGAVIEDLFLICRKHFGAEPSGTFLPKSIARSSLKKTRTK